MTPEIRPNSGDSRLNPEQQAVVEHTAGPLLVVAGAGTGKTRVLAHRAAALVRAGASPECLLLLTFTRRSAEELKARVSAVLDAPELALPWCGTFHSVAARMLRAHGPRIGLPQGFSILDESDSRSLLWRVACELFPSRDERRTLPSKSVLYRIHSYAANTLVPVAAALPKVAAASHADRLPDVECILRQYGERKSQSDALDYDDLLLRWCDLLAETGQDCVGQFDYIMVDEYQDTNVLQARALRLLCGGRRNIMVVGDDAQAIYGFRGATVANILQFGETFPGGRRLQLHRNYRSTQGILDAANILQAGAREGFPKTLVSSSGPGERPRLCVCGDDREQANLLASEIVEAHRDEGVSFAEQAVLFRSSFHSFKLEFALQQFHVPYRKFGGPRFADSAHMKDVLAFLRCRENVRDESAWLRVLTLLPGVGDVSAGRLFRELVRDEAPVSCLGRQRFPSRALPYRDDLLKALERLFAADDDGTLCDQIDAALGFYLPVLPELHDDPEARAAELKELRLLAAGCTSRRQFLDDVLVGDDSVFAGERAGGGEYVTLSTVHSAKGCEWPLVYVMNLVEGGLPSGPSQGDADLIEEERRLLYVAMTRAKRRLVLAYPRYRQVVVGSEHSLAPCRPSRFLDEALLACCDDGSDSEDVWYDYDDVP